MSAAIPLFKRSIVVAHAIVDAEDIERLARFRWTLHPDGYARRHTGSGRGAVTILMHREVLNLPHGVGFAAGVVDHINGDKLDNRKANLRITTQSSNTQRGSISVGQSGFFGVSPQRGRWHAQIRFVGRRIYLGSFATPESAASVYDAAALRLHGQHARINAVAARFGGANANP